MTAGKVIDNWVEHQGTKDQLPPKDFRALNKVRWRPEACLVNILVAIRSLIGQFMSDGLLSATRRGPTAAMLILPAHKAPLTSPPRLSSVSTLAVGIEGW